LGTDGQTHQVFFDIHAEYLQLVKQSFAALRLKCLPNLKYPAILIYST